MNQLLAKYGLACVVALVALNAAPTVSYAQVANGPEVLAMAANIDNDTFARASIRLGTREPYWLPVYDTLVHLTSDAKLEPGMATAWQWNEAGDALTLTLREGVKFTDGTPFDSEVVRANLIALRDGGGENAFMLASLRDVEIASPTKVVLRLSAPDPALIENLASAAGAMASTISITALDAATRPIGSGPYVLDADATVPGRQYVYRSNPDYWDGALVKFKTLTITPISDLSARLNSLRSGQIDAALGDATVVAEAKGSGLSVTTYPVDWEGVLIADRNGKVLPALADKRVRQAIALAFDKESILKFMRAGSGTVTSQIFSKDASAYVAELDNTYGYDRERARKLMAEAGYVDGFSITLPELRLFAAFTPVVTQMLGEIGIKANWVPVAPTEAIAELQSGKYPMFVIRLAAQTSWSDIRRVVAPDASWNMTHAQNEELNALINAAQRASSEEERTVAYQNINRWLVEEAWFAPWYRVDSVILTNKEVEVHPRPWSVASSVQYFQPRN
ncbi:ABC transporter substrate-binding protein [Shinella sp. DD12]|uniref:ABC transporter substrate-binding protein n=1 Tax=Shinella sp. DD12 TaxID=1410620 RepID=UPI0004379A92|nr:ABC transporter substrate-binding protein [Shinella sp. DD12]EYR83776.1 ABC-type dipeptide transport system periplasmic component [Shinella sp. DD12]